MEIVFFYRVGGGVGGGGGGGPFVGVSATIRPLYGRSEAFQITF